MNERDSFSTFLDTGLPIPLAYIIPFPPLWFSPHHPSPKSAHPSSLREPMGALHCRPKVPTPHSCMLEKGIKVIVWRRKEITTHGAWVWELYSWSLGWDIGSNGHALATSRPPQRPSIHHVVNVLPFHCIGGVA